MVMSWKDKNDYLCKLIKQVSDKYGGDDEKWLKEYIDQVLIDNKHDIDKAINCFRLLFDQTKNDQYIDV